VPELPEVETLRRGLESTLQNRYIVDVIIGNAKVLKGQSEATLRERILGKQITHFRRRGKYLLITLSDTTTNLLNVPEAPLPPFFLCIHLKMRGLLLVEEAASEPGDYHCVTLLLKDENGRQQALRFYDMWTWGEFRVLQEAEIANLIPSLVSMGEEPLEADWGTESLGKQLKNRKTAIKPTLLDQKVVAGIGNIYADESLFRAGIHPERPANSLTADETVRLVDSVKTILTSAVEGGGTTSSDYFDLAGRPGRFTPQVYDRGGELCKVCGTVLSRIRLGGRGTVFCETCQPPLGVR
jgi:formamidopyrimidine-DNA glycosylase